MKDITPQQQKVLDCIQVYINKTGFPFPVEEYSISPSSVAMILISII